MYSKPQTEEISLCLKSHLLVNNDWSDNNNNNNKVRFWRHQNNFETLLVCIDLSVSCMRSAQNHYENMPIQYTENFTTKKWKFSDKNSDIFNISAQNIDCGYSLEPPQWGSSIEYPQSMFLSRNKKKNVYPCQPQIYYIKVGFKGFKII